MPKINVLKKELFQFIGKEFSKSSFSIISHIAEEQFEELCFEFGLEVEFGTAGDMNMNRVDDSGNAIDISKEMVYCLEVAANRYDLLCLEGAAQSFRSYLGIAPIPRISIKNEGVLHKILVKPETKDVRHYVVGAILRNIKFDVQSYNSFIDLQDKLH